MRNENNDCHEAFRAEVRGFLDAKFGADMRAMASRQAGVFADGDLARKWHHILYEQGWVAPFWPEEYGGPGWTSDQIDIFQEECAIAGTPRLPAMGLALCAPVIMRYGTPEQKDYFLPRMLSGEHYWCQGYSEPQAGSDLASLQTRAVRDGSDYVINGSKIWTTHAQHANWIFLLVRTNTDVQPQKGITFLVAPLDVEGISIKPIISLSGEHEVNQVFLDDVRIPVSNRMGPENEGWTVAKYLLEHERSGGAVGVGLRVALNRSKSVARLESGPEGRRLIDDYGHGRKTAQLEIEVMATQALEARLDMESASEGIINGAASVKKLLASTLGQRIDELTMEALGYYAMVDQSSALEGRVNEPPVGPDYAATPTAKFLNSRASTVFGGSSEIQRNILARIALGLPKPF